MSGICGECGSSLCDTCNDCASVCSCPTSEELTDSVIGQDLVTIDRFANYLHATLLDFELYVDWQISGDTNQKSRKQWFDAFLMYLKVNNRHT